MLTFLRVNREEVWFVYSFILRLFFVRNRQNERVKELETEPA